MERDAQGMTGAGEVAQFRQRLPCTRKDLNLFIPRTYFIFTKDGYGETCNPSTKEAETCKLVGLTGQPDLPS